MAETQQMKNSARRITALLAVTLSCVLPNVVHGQAFPAKPVRMIVASSAGSNPDTIARVFAGALGQQLGQQVVVDDRAGAGGNIGAEVAARAAPDGYTVFLAHTNHSINASLYRKLSYDILTDFSPLTLVAQSAFVCVVHPSLPARTAGDLLKIAKARPGDLNYASAGTGSGTYFAAEYFNALGNVKMVHVAYTGGGPALASVLSGETSVYFTPLATGLAHIRSGRLRALGVTSAKRLPELPDVAPIADTLRGYEVQSWAGLMVPVKTPKDVAATVYKSAVATLGKPETMRRFEDLGFTVQTSRPEEMQSFVKTEIDKYARLIRDSGMALQ